MSRIVYLSGGMSLAPISQQNSDSQMIIRDNALTMERVLTFKKGCKVPLFYGGGGIVLLFGRLTVKANHRPAVLNPTSLYDRFHRRFLYEISCVARKYNNDSDCNLSYAEKMEKARANNWQFENGAKVAVFPYYDYDDCNIAIAARNKKLLAKFFNWVDFYDDHPLDTEFDDNDEKYKRGSSLGVPFSFFRDTEYDELSEEEKECTHFANTIFYESFF